MIKLFAFLLLRNTTIKKPVWTIVDKNRNMPFINTINVRPLFSPDGEEYNIGQEHNIDEELDEFKDLLPL